MKLDDLRRELKKSHGSPNAIRGRRRNDRLRPCDRCKNTGFESPLCPCRYCVKGIRAVSIAQLAGKVPNTHRVKCRDCSEMMSMNDAVGKADEDGRVTWTHAPGKDCYPF